MTKFRVLFYGEKAVDEESPFPSSAAIAVAARLKLTGGHGCLVVDADGSRTCWRVHRSETWYARPEEPES
jgi:hypothetical protein